MHQYQYSSDGATGEPRPQQAGMLGSSVHAHTHKRGVMRAVSQPLSRRKKACGNIWESNRKKQYMYTPGLGLSGVASVKWNIKYGKT